MRKVSKLSRKALGNLGENLALKHLKSKGYRIIDRNFNSRYGEIDIIALEGQKLVFVEVKTRFSQNYGRPDEAITPWKIRHMIKAAQFYKLIHPEMPDSLRLDAVLVDLSAEDADKFKKIRIIRNITQ